jgi:hypothetical protein
VAINGEVKCCITVTYDALSTKFIKNLSVEAEYLSSGVFGQVKAMSLILEGSPVRVSIQNQGHGEAGEWATGNRDCTLQSIDPPCSCSNCARNRQEIEYSSQEAISNLTSDKGTTLPMLNNSIGGAEIHVHVSQEQVTIHYIGLEGGGMRNSGPQYTD